MLKAGALYFAIIIAFFIAVISASLVMLAAHYRNNYLQDIRFQRLIDNLDSGVAYALTSRQSRAEEIIDVHHNGVDSLLINRSLWGIYELVQLETSIQQDTLKRIFLMGKQPDSLALYLADEDRPLSISGGTRLTGNVALPKSGLRQAYAEGKPYNGEKLVFHGQVKDSQRSLPPMEEEVLTKLFSYLENTTQHIPNHVGSLKISFDGETQLIYVGKIARLEQVELKGKIILLSDSVVTIAASAKIADVQVYAPIIKVETGFQGQCQLFARDSLIVADKAIFNYPSSLGILRTDKSVGQPQLTLGNEVSFAGVIFSFEKLRSPLQTMVSLGRATTVNGEVFCTGLLKIEKDVNVKGKISCNRLIMLTPQTLYENFLIDVNFNRRARSQYYLSAALFGMQRTNKVLKWLN